MVVKMLWMAWRDGYWTVTKRMDECCWIVRDGWERMGGWLLDGNEMMGDHGGKVRGDKGSDPHTV